MDFRPLNSANCEVRSEIYFLNAKDVKLTAMYWQIGEVCRENALSNARTFKDNSITEV